ncbi:hypothetical protein OQA88_9165 [Cercophora sp. LCS_1]
MKQTRPFRCSIATFVGVMQIVAKVLELWFILIACGFAYNIIWRLAQHRSLPMQYLFLHNRLADPMVFLSKSFWVGPLRPKPGSRALLYAFSALVVVLSLVCNLMGPAVAVLLLPTKGTAEVGSLIPRYFVQLKASVSVGPLDPHNHTFVRIPSRQILTRLEFDVMSYDAALAPELTRLMQEELEADGLETMLPDEPVSEKLQRTYNTTLDIAIARRGPEIVSSSACTYGLGNISVLAVGQDKFVRCYPFGYTSSGGSSLGVTLDLLELSDGHDDVIKCIRVGSGWTTARNDHAQFFIFNDTEPRVSRPSASRDLASVNAYSVSDAVYLNSTTRSCANGNLSTGSKQVCDWDAIFSDPPPSPRLAEISRSQQIIEYDYPVTFPDGSTYSPWTYNIPWCHSYAYLSFATYVADDPTTLSGHPGVKMASRDGLVGDPIYIHPGWIPAVWQAIEDTAPTGSTGQMPGNLMVNALINDISRGFVGQMSKTNLFHRAMITTVHSLIGFEEQTDPPPTATDPDAQPILRTSITGTVWAYGLSTRTSILGFSVAVAGCLFALVNALLVFGKYCEGPGAMGLFAKALAQSQVGRTEGSETDEKWLMGLDFKLSGRSAKAKEGDDGANEDKKETADPEG